MDKRAPALVLPAPAAGSSNLAGSTATNGADIRGIKGPVPIPNSYAWLFWLFGGLLLLLAGWLLWKRYRRKNITAKPALIIPPHRKAKDRLRNAEELLSDPYAFCSLVSAVVRTYVEDRFELHAPERTTEEFLAELRTSSVLRLEHKGLLEEFLERCDLVKFARFEPMQEELKALLNAALRFIDETAPLASPETPAPGVTPNPPPEEKAA